MKAIGMKPLAGILAALAIVSGPAIAAKGDNTMMGGGWGAGQMMGPCGPGMGMMGPGMMEHGMMMGPGMGMMGPGMMGPGMMAGALPDLTDDQRKKLAKIQEEARARHWDSMKLMRAEQFKLQELFYADQQDADAIRSQYKKLAELRQQMVDASLEAHKQLNAVLTKEQKNALRSWRHGWMMWGN